MENPHQNGGVNGTIIQFIGDSNMDFPCLITRGFLNICKPSGKLTLVCGLEHLLVSHIYIIPLLISLMRSRAGGPGVYKEITFFGENYVFMRCRACSLRFSGPVFFTCKLDKDRHFLNSSFFSTIFL